MEGDSVQQQGAMSATHDANWGASRSGATQEQKKPMTAAEMVAAFDRGEIIWSLEMGGLGPGYEQAIQLAAIEFTRAGLGCEWEPSEQHAATFNALCEETLRGIDAGLLGLSGAQFAAAQWLAFQWLAHGGPDALKERAKAEGRENDLIMIDNSWPRVTRKEEG